MGHSVYLFNRLSAADVTHAVKLTKEKFRINTYYMTDEFDVFDELRETITDRKFLAIVRATDGLQICTAQTRELIQEAIQITFAMCGRPTETIAMITESNHESLSALLRAIDQHAQSEEHLLTIDEANQLHTILDPLV